MTTNTFSGYTPQIWPTYAFILILFLLSISASAKTWYINKNQNADQLQYLINQASSGDVIYFVDGANYDIGGRVILVNKGITFQGFSPNGYNSNTRGASGIQTNLNNVVSFLIRSNNVKFNNIKINAVNNDVVLIDARSQRYIDNFTSPGYTANDQYTGIKFTNVELNGGFYSCFAGNGMQVDFKNVSFLDFARIGYINDRRTRVNSTKTATFLRCKFQPQTPTGTFGFDSRGISFDAGNTSYPVVWSAEGSYIIECDFINTGVAFSRIKNVNISANTFTDNTAYIDMIHIEEFSNNMLISWNQFNCNAASTRAANDYERSRIITLDSELQAVTDITISNNTASGQYNFFINGYAPTNVSITNNNFSNAFPFGSNIIDFRYYENYEKTGETIDANQEFVSRNITVTGNTGFKNWNKGIRVNVPTNGNTININTSQFSSGKVNLNYLQDPTPLRWTGVYEIVNAGNTTKKLASDGTAYGITTNGGSGNNAKWEITWVPPYYYTIKNLSTNQYLETHKGYTEKEILDGVSENVYPFIVYSGNELPRWILRKTADSGLFKILPAGNEKQSVLAMSGNNVKLLMHKKFNSDGTRSIKEPNNFGKWWITPSSSAKDIVTVQGEALEGLKITPNVINDIATIYFEDDANPVVDVSFYNTTGALVKKEKINSHNNNAIDVSSLASGVYLVQTSNDIVEKIIIK